MKILTKVCGIKKILIFLIPIIFILDCTRNFYDEDMSVAELQTTSEYLKDHFEWDPLKARKYFLKYSLRSGDTNLYNLYKKHDYNLLWIERGDLDKNAMQLIKSLQSSWKEGLSNESYHLGEIYHHIHDLQSIRKMRTASLKQFIRLDILFSEAYLNYASDLLSGKINPNELDSIWEAHPREKDLVKRMEQALETATISYSLNELKPEQAQYDKLAGKLKEYMIIRDKGGWKPPGYFSLLATGDSNKNVLSLKEFLRNTNDLELVDDAYMKSGLFDAKLKKAVIRFQKRHGLEMDGLVGIETLKEMNKSVEHRIDQIRVNMERLRWLPENFGEKYILINLPEFKLRYYHKGYLLEEMKIVIGDIENYTPVLKDTLREIVFNPAWNIPKSIAVEKILPKIKADSSYIDSHDYILLKKSYLSKDTINPDSIKWSEINRDNFQFYMVQKPGKLNALGKVKFLFPNHHAIYLHDTPSKHHFNGRERNFSHGCIRLERPLDLALELLDGQLSWTDMQKILESKETKRIPLSETISIHFLYTTAWVNKDNRIHFRKDFYHYDKMTLEKLDD
ncbi:MAG: L,D-transpeptidase family protein [Bacteroidota bacterium]